MERLRRKMAGDNAAKQTAMPLVGQATVGLMGLILLAVLVLLPPSSILISGLCINMQWSKPARLLLSPHQYLRQLILVRRFPFAARYQ